MRLSIILLVLFDSCQKEKTLIIRLYEFHISSGIEHEYQTSKKNPTAARPDGSPKASCKLLYFCFICTM